jgi:hypothetical protein
VVNLHVHLLLLILHFLDLIEASVWLNPWVCELKLAMITIMLPGTTNTQKPISQVSSWIFEYQRCPSSWMVEQRVVLRLQHVSHYSLYVSVVVRRQQPGLVCSIDEFEEAAQQPLEDLVGYQVSQFNDAHAPLSEQLGFFTVKDLPNKTAEETCHRFR